jgi:hypothetical protein
VGRSRHNLPITRGAGLIGRRMAMLLLALACLTEVRAASAQAPSTLLLRAQLVEALAFATQTASQRGWTVVSSGPASVTFEQPLSPDPDGSVALLRITAIGVDSPGGVAVSLAAQEVRPAKGMAEDVTQRYRDNLLNALDSLASKWGLRPGAGAGALAPPTAAASQVRVAPISAPSPPISAPAPTSPQAYSIAVPAVPLRQGVVTAETSAPHLMVGTWAYYAERHAQSRGCTLGDQGAVLEERFGENELHRVYCVDGRQVLVHCVAGTCADAR